jgi:hypothetical protein
VKISKYQIFGERNSGTNYLDKVLQFNFDLKPTSEFGYKHWFIKGHYPRGKKNLTTDNECLTSLNKSADTIFVFIVRESLSWLQSMHRTPWHAPEHRGLTFSEFIRKPWVSYETDLPADHGPDSSSPWQQSRDGKFFIERAKNICELRNLKNEHFLSLDGDVANFFIIRQDTMLSDLKIMLDIFKLKTKYHSLILPNYRPPIESISINEQDLNFINSELDQRLENILGFSTSNQKLGNSSW